MSSKLRLTVKAANGAVPDFRVDAQQDWSVRELKGHLYRHYPTHPVSRGSLWRACIHCVAGEGGRVCEVLQQYRSYV